MNLSPAQLDRACGAIVGAAVGDALGAGYEFGSAPLGPDGPAMIGGGLGGFEPGEWTDDTSMTSAILKVTARGADLRTDEALDAIAAEFRGWFDTHPADIGIQTARVLRTAGPEPTGAAMTAAAAAYFRAGNKAGGNGSLMRTAPVALAHLDDPAALVEAAMKVSALTHADPRAGEACALWCLAIRHAVLTGSLDVAAGLAYLSADARDFWQERLDQCGVGSPNRFTPNGYVVTALQAAWASVLAGASLEESLGIAVGIGHDTDTVASIAGALLGARSGLSAIPAHWRRILHGYPGWRVRDLEGHAFLAARKGELGGYGWPLAEQIDYALFEAGLPALAPHPYDDGVLLGSASALRSLPDGVDAVVSLCLTGTADVPAGVEHLTVRLIDQTDPAYNPNLDFVLLDTARLIAALRGEGKRVLLHCVAAQSRTPAVGIAYALLRGAPLAEASRKVCAALPAARPNAAFQAALRRIAMAGTSAGAPSQRPTG